MKDEEWVTIPYEDQYEVSCRGVVRNVHTKNVKSLRSDRYGYDRVTLYPSGKTYTVHRLVASVFLYKGESDTQVNHINGDKKDNSIGNLEWCNASYNCRHRDTFLQSKWKGQMNPSAKLSNELVKKVKYSDFGTLNNREIGDLFEISSEQVRRIRSNERWKHI